MSGEQHKVVGIGFGVAGTYLALQLGQETGSVMIAVGSALGCWLPDMDHNRTKLGRKRKVVTGAVNKVFTYGLILGIALSIVLAFLMIRGLIQSNISLNMLGMFVIGAVLVLVAKNKIGNSSEFKWATKHRGFMHTCIPIGCLVFLLPVSDYSLWKWSVIGLIVGYASHLIADCTTTEGCPLLYPLAKFNLRLPIFNSEKKQAIGCWILAVLPVIAVHYLTNYL